MTADQGRTLYLLRHAQAIDHAAGGDKQRPLSLRGQQQAADLAPLLAGERIDLVLCSTAERTRQTLAALGLSAPVQYMDALYEAGTQTLRQRIGEIEDQVRGLLVVGHAPSIPGLASELTAQLDGGAADQLGCHFPTAWLAWFTVATDWATAMDPWPAGPVVNAFGDRTQLGRT